MNPEAVTETGGRLQRSIAFLWLALSAGWAIVIVVTDALAWPLALWVATTLGPLTMLRRKSTTWPDPESR